MQKKPRGRYQKLEDELERSNQDFIDHQKHQQQVSVYVYKLYYVCMYVMYVCMIYVCMCYVCM